MEHPYTGIETQLRQSALDLLRVADALALGHPVQAYDELKALDDRDRVQFTGSRGVTEWACRNLLQMLTIEDPRR